MNYHNTGGKETSMMSIRIKMMYSLSFYDSIPHLDSFVMSIRQTFICQQIDDSIC